MFENQGDYVLDVTCTELLLGPVVIACSCCIDHLYSSQAW